MIYLGFAKFYTGVADPLVGLWSAPFEKPQGLRAFNDFYGLVYPADSNLNEAIARRFCASKLT
ncbi:MAG: hypothetical protein LUC34_07580 [Campylobacter sp.]|nr:hypothetical protein [Campylobacter sp.]